MADLLDPLTTFTNDGACQLHNNRKGELKKNIHEGVASLFLSLLTLAYIFWDGDLCCDDWTSDITVRASAA